MEAKNNASLTWISISMVDTLVIVFLALAFHFYLIRFFSDLIQTASFFDCEGQNFKERFLIYILLLSYL